jgi:hypothetical protein
MKKAIGLVLVACVVMMAGCAKMPLRADYVEEKNPQRITADANSAVVCFFRPSAFTGGGMSYFVFEDNTKIGLLKSGSYFMHRSMPGKHTYLAETEARAAVTLDVKAGETYYVEGGIGMGFWAGRPQLTEVTKPVADKELSGLKYLRLSTDEEAAQIRAKESQ